MGTLLCDADGGKGPAMTFCTQAHAMQAFPVSNILWSLPLLAHIIMIMIMIMMMCSRRE